MIYHGNESWDFGDRLCELIDDIPESISDYIPDYKYLVYDFSVYSEAEIKGQIKLRLFLKLLSHLFSDDFEKRLQEVLPLMNELKKKNTGMEYIETVVKYILNVGEEISLNELNKKAKNISSEGSEFIMTIAEKIHEEGKEEGRKAGKKETMREMTIKFLINKFKKVPENYKKQIKELDIEELEVIANKIVDMKNLSELEDYLD